MKKVKTKKVKFFAKTKAGKTVFFKATKTSEVKPKKIMAWGLYRYGDNSLQVILFSKSLALYELMRVEHVTRRKHAIIRCEITYKLKI